MSNSQQMNLYCQYCDKLFDAKEGLLGCLYGSREYHVLQPVFSKHANMQIKIATDSKTRINPFISFKKFISSSYLYKENEFSSIIDLISNNLRKIGEPGFELTPIFNNEKLEESVGGHPKSLFIKYEAENVSGSHKSRHALGNLLYIESIRRLRREEMKKNLAIYSCGNAALGAASVALAFDYQLYTFVPESVDQAILSRLVKYKAKVVKVKRDSLGAGDPCYIRFHEAVETLGFIPCSCSGPDNWSNIEGGATIIYEFIFQMKNQYGFIPDVLIIQVGGGALASAIIYGLRLLLKAGIISKVPKIYLVQTESCYPLYKSFVKLRRIAGQINNKTFSQIMKQIGKQGSSYMKPWSKNMPESLAEGILDDITYDWLNCLEGVIESKGEVLVVKEDLIRQAYELVKSLGMNVSATGTAGLAGLLKLRKNGKIGSQDKIGLFFTGIDIRPKANIKHSLVESRSKILSSSDPINVILH